MELYFNDKSYNADNEFIYESYSINEDDSQQAQVNNSTKLSPDDFEPTKFKEMIGKIKDFKSFINKLSNKNSSNNGINSEEVKIKLDGIKESIGKFVEFVNNLQIPASVSQKPAI